MNEQMKWRRMGPDEIICGDDKIHHSIDDFEWAHFVLASIGKTVRDSKCVAAWTLRPTPSQIEEEARKAGKAPVTTEKREPKLYEFWKLNDGRTAWLEPDRTHNPTDFIARVIRGGWGPDGDCEDRFIYAEANFIRKHEIDRPSTPSEIEDWIAKCGKPAKYTPEAAQSAQKGPMPIETQVTKQIKETIAAKALREAMDKVKADQERVDAIRSLVALEEEKRKAKEHLKGIDDQIATLSKKWLKWVGK